MNIAGIDQSLTGSGITVSENGKYHYFLIETKKEKGTKSPSIDNTRRLLYIKKQIKEILIKYKIEFIAMEGLAFGATGRSVMTIGGLTHILRELYIELNIDFIIIPPKTLKKFWFGNGNAKKEEMVQEAVDRKCDINIMKNYGTKKIPNIMFDDNIVDSMALCIFIQEMKSGKLNPDFIEKIEQSKDVVFTR